MADVLRCIHHARSAELRLTVDEATNEIRYLFRDEEQHDADHDDLQDQSPVAEELAALGLLGEFVTVAGEHGTGHNFDE